MCSTSAKLFPNNPKFAYVFAHVVTGATTGAILSANITLRSRRQYFEYSSIWKTYKEMRRKNISLFASAKTHALRNAIHHGIFHPLENY